MPSVLMVLSAAEVWTLADGTAHPTGVWAEELIVPHQIFEGAGCTITIATPGGAPPTIDPMSLRGLPRVVRRLRAELERLADRLARPTPLADVDPDAYDIVFYPGGHAPMEDLVVDETSGALLTRRLAAGAPLALLCHAPAAAFAARRADGTWPFSGYQMTALSNVEEGVNSFARRARWLLESRLRTEGARYVRGPVPFAPYVTVDQSLYTGQNPASSARLARRILTDQGYPLMRASVSRLIPADPATLYELVHDVTTVGRRSPETTDARWIVPGRTFKGWNRIGPLYRWTTVSSVTEDAPGRVFAWHTGWPSHTDWRFEFAPQDGQTLVTESFVHTVRQPFPIRALQRLAGVDDRVAHLRAGMDRTLERLAEQASAIA